MNSKIDYSTIPDLADKNILSQKISFKNNSKIVETIYLNENNEQVNLKQTLMKKAVSERQKWAKFGAAAPKGANDGITTIGAEVNIEYVNKGNNFIKYPVPIPITRKRGIRFGKRISNKYEDDKQSNKDGNGRYLPPQKRNSYNKYGDDKQSNGDDKQSNKDGNGRYLPPQMRNRNNSSSHGQGAGRNHGQRTDRNYNEFVVIVKNVPYGFNSYDLKDEGNKYGYVTRARVLDNKGIGFIHYKTQKEQEFSIQNLHRTNKLGGHMLIHAEKAS